MRLLQLDDLLTSYTNARPEAGLFVRLPRSSRLQFEMPRAEYARLGSSPHLIFAGNIGGERRSLTASADLGSAGVEQRGVPGDKRDAAPSDATVSAMAFRRPLPAPVTRAIAG